MIRFMLALLAALTGIGVSGTQVEARVCSADVAAASAQLGECATDSSAIALAWATPALIGRALADDRETPLRALAVHVPTVLLGPDRAHE